MSKIKVDTIESRNGTLTVGASGDTVVYTSGSIPNSSLENSAITINGTSTSLGGSIDVGGAIDWQTTAKTSDFTAVAGEGYFVDTSSGAITATLPASPSGGDQVAFKDYAESFGTNNLTIARNGSNVQGLAANAIIRTDRASVILVYVDATKGWLFTNESNVDNLTPTAPDAPIIGTATATDATTATVTFTAPSDDGGSTITSYTATSSPDGITGTISQAGSGTITVTGLTTDQAYTFTVTATNAEGTSPASAASNSVTPESLMAATGGTITTDGDYKIHTFTSSGTFTVTRTSPTSNSVDYLVVAGGGGSGSYFGAAGGAGGFRYSATTFTSPPSSPAHPLRSTSAIPVSAQGYSVTVGGGGTATPSSPGTQGSSSTFSTITSAGGGFGGGGAPPQGTVHPGGNGGSGGGAGGDSGDAGTAGSGNTPSVSPPQGQNGNTGKGGAGGGAVQAGNPFPGAGGDGAGVPSAFGTSGESSGSFYYFAGGGGGQDGTSNAQPGGLGGGGDSYYFSIPTNDGTTNTGGGGGGDGGDGGSGIVILRYKFQ